MLKHLLILCSVSCICLLPLPLCARRRPGAACAVCNSRVIWTRQAAAAGRRDERAVLVPRSGHRLHLPQPGEGRGGAHQAGRGTGVSSLLARWFYSFFFVLVGAHREERCCSWRFLSDIRFNLANVFLAYILRVVVCSSMLLFSVGALYRLPVAGSRPSESWHCTRPGFAACPSRESW